MLTFSVRPERGIWSSYSLNPGQDIEISCIGCVAEFFEFSMRTRERGVGYDLYSASKYVLRWSDSKNLWDIFKVDN